MKFVFEESPEDNSKIKSNNFFECLSVSEQFPDYSRNLKIKKRRRRKKTGKGIERIRISVKLKRLRSYWIKQSDMVPNIFRVRHEIETVKGP